MGMVAQASIDGAPPPTAVVVDPRMRHAYELLRRLADSDLPVLIVGETGVGKELAARALHAASHRASAPMIVVNCAALPDNLVESELFGHRRGAFTGAERDKPGLFALAHGGTLFLDEVGELPLAVQAKLLRAVETRAITPIGATEITPLDFRIVAATNRDLAAEVKAHRFRSDLYFRLGAAIVELPPLRERVREIPDLARALLARATAALGRGPTAFSDAAMHALLARRYPGNVRELANVIHYAAAVAQGRTITPADLPGEPALPRARTIGAEIEALERQRMADALAACHGNQSRAADLIGMPRRTFVTKLGRYQLR